MSARSNITLGLLLLLGCSDPQTEPGYDQGVIPGGDGGGAPGPRQVCPGPALSPVQGGRCRVLAGKGSALLIRGTLLLPDRTLEGGQLLLAGERILCAACDCSGSPGHADATALECPAAVVSPGLINPHDHLGWTRSWPVQPTARYDHRHEWRKAKNGKPKVPAWNVDFSDEAMAWGEARQLLGGATSIMGEGSVAGLLRNLDWDNEGLGRPSVKNTTFPLGDKEGEMLASGCGYPALPDPSAVKQAVAWVPHVAEGVGAEARNEFLCISGAQGGVDAVLANTSLIHAVGITVADARRLAQAGSRVIWSPRSNISLYGYTADVVLLRNLGVTLALGTDWTVTGSMNMLRELACADHLNRQHYGGAFTERDLWRMATEGAARSASMDDLIGTLAPGRFADITVFDTSGGADHAAVVRAGVGEVALVLRGGKVLHGDAELVAALAPSSGQGCEALDICGRSKRICLQRETGWTLADLKARLGQGETYPLFFCGEPEGEPTCVPSRPGLYDGQTSTSDRDGDGVADAEDSCPDLFNPPRPLDHDKQPDADGDGVGDACDPTP